MQTDSGLVSLWGWGPHSTGKLIPQFCILLSPASGLVWTVRDNDTETALENMGSVSPAL